MTNLLSSSDGLGGEALEVQIAGLLASVERGMEKVLGPYDLVSIEFKLLKFCLEQDECTATQLAEVLPTDPARISRLVNGLVERGLVARRRLPNDRRIVMLSLTEAGKDRIQESDESVQMFFESLVEGISDTDLGSFRSVICAMTANYEARSREESDKE